MLDVDGAVVATYTMEPAEAPARADVVLCHGTPWSAAVWAPVARALSDTHRVFLWDMPGYGQSITDTPATIHLHRQASRLATLIDHWGLTTPHVVAHDIGGAVALGSHLLNDVDYASLYLLDIVSLPPWGSPFFRLVAQNEQVFAAVPRPLHRALAREYIAGAAAGLLGADVLDDLVRPWSTIAGQRAFYHQIAQLRPDQTEPIVDRLDRVRCRTRIGWGEADPWIPRDQAAELAARLPGAVTAHYFPDAGHLVPLEASRDVLAELVTWLDA